MADQALQDYFAGPAMTQIANSPLVIPGIPWFLDEKIRTPSSSKPIGIDFMWEQFTGTRVAGHITNYNSPPVHVEVNGESKKFATCLGGREAFDIPYELIQGLRSPIPFVNQMAMGVFLRRMKQFRTRADTRRINGIASAFLTGALYVLPSNDGRGKITNSTTSGASNVLSNYAPTTLGVGSVIPNSGGATVPDFATSTTDIPGFFRVLTDAFIKTSNYVPKQIHYGVNLPSYMGQTNTAMQAYWSRNQVTGKQFYESNEVPNGFADYSWRAAHKQYYLDDTGSQTAITWIGANTMVITPEVDESWWEMVEGSAQVPIGTIPVASSMDINAMMDQLAFKWGVSGYSIMDPQTFNISAVVQDWFYPTPKNPNTHWIVTVH